VEDLAMPIPPALKVGRTRDGYCIRVEGRGESQASPAVLGLFVIQILDNASRSVVVDLSDCEELDSRFVGCLLDLQRHYGHGHAPRFAITANLDSCPRLLSSSCSDRPLNLGSERPETIGEELVLPPLEAGKSDLECHLMEWHRWLAELGGTDQPASKRSLDRALRECACS
jgi:hypothetical protein